MIFKISSGHSREGGNPVKLRRWLDSGSLLRYGRNDVISRWVNNIDYREMM